jgi:hypothetical protein
MITARNIFLAAALLVAPPLASASFAQSTTGGTTVTSPISGYATHTLKTKHHHKVIHGLKTGPGAKAGSGSGMGESSGSSSGN